jgi:hypothetical protein
VSTGAKEDESSTGCIWAVGFHHVTARSWLARILKLMNRILLKFSHFFSGCSKPRITETADTEPADMRAHLYYNPLRHLELLAQLLSVNYKTMDIICKHEKCQLKFNKIMNSIEISGTECKGTGEYYQKAHIRNNKTCFNHV